jgi:hypothetical protein
MTNACKSGVREIRLPCYGINIRLNRQDSPEGLPCGTITSELQMPGRAAADRPYNAAIDGLEALVLAHACAGIDVTSPAYIEGVETAVEAIVNYYGP